MKSKTLIATFLFFNLLVYSQRQEGGQFSLPKFNLSPQWFFTQSVLDHEFSDYNYKKTETTYYLNQDNNSDGVPDYLIHLKVNDYSDDLILYSVIGAESGSVGSDVAIYQEYPNTLVAFDGTNVYSPSDINFFYRFSKVNPGNFTTRNVTSLPLLFQRPNNNSRSCKIQIVYNIRVAKPSGIDLNNTSEYHFYNINENDPFENLKGKNPNYLKFHSLSKIETIWESSNGIKTNRIRWGAEYVKEKIIHAITLKW